MLITKRNGSEQEFSFKKLKKRFQTAFSTYIETTYAHFDNESQDINTQTSAKNVKFSLIPKKENINFDEFTNKILTGLFDNINTIDIDNYAAETAATMVDIHPDYQKLATGLCVTKLHKETLSSFSESAEKLFNNVNKSTNISEPLISIDIYNIIKQNSKLIDEKIKHQNDFLYTYIGLKILETSYLLKIDKQIIERPQFLLMRVALGIYGDDLPQVFKIYKNMSNHMYTHATPTLFNAGTPKPQMSSCYLLPCAGDSVESIYKTITDCAIISKHAGGIGVSIHNIRATGSQVKGGGKSNGIIPMLRVFNETARYINQGGKRNGSIAIYLEPWHADILGFLNLKKNTGSEIQRARDLFYGLWIPDLFMERVKKNERWSLMCPSICPGLDKVFGKEFKKLYCSYETKNLYKRQLPAQWLWDQIIRTQIETGNPYILFKDTINYKNNQKNLGPITTSNLCTEIMQYSSEKETAVCNLASVCLPKYISIRKKHITNVFGNCATERASAAQARNKNESKLIYGEHPNDQQKIPNAECETTPTRSTRATLESRDSRAGQCETENMPHPKKNEHSTERSDEYEKYFNHILLGDIVKEITYNLNQIIDKNYYPIKEAKNSNLKHRPIGIGVQGLADVFAILKLPFTSEKAKKLNKKIFETIYYSALTASVENSKTYGSYDSFEYSPISQGIFQFDLWDLHKRSEGSGRPQAARSGSPHEVPSEARAAAGRTKEKIQTNRETRFPSTTPQTTLIEQNETAQRRRPLGARPKVGATVNLAPQDSFVHVEQFGEQNEHQNFNEQKWDWDFLKQNIKNYGLRNSLVTAPMPTASTSQIMGNIDAFEPITSNIYTRRLLSGEFISVNHHLINDLILINKWTPDIRNSIIEHNGSIQQLEIPIELKNIYKTVWEMKMKDIIDMAGDRGRFIDQSQSMNLFIESPTVNQIGSMHMYSWLIGLKTGMYYLRTKSAINSTKVILRPCASCSS